MRIIGRTLRPATLAERRLMLSELGTSVLRIPRRMNPYFLARKLARAARGDSPDVLFLRDIAARRQPLPSPTFPLPDRDTSDPEPEGGAPAPAFADATTA